MASPKACSHVWATSTSSTYDTAKQATRIVVFKYICQQSRRRRPLILKYSSTRRRSSTWKVLSPQNLRPRPDFGRRSGEMDSLSLDVGANAPAAFKCGHGRSSERSSTDYIGIAFTHRQEGKPARRAGCDQLSE